MLPFFFEQVINHAAISGIRSGLVEIPLAVFGAWAVQLARPILPYAMGLQREPCYTKSSPKRIASDSTVSPRVACCLV